MAQSNVRWTDMGWAEFIKAVSVLDSTRVKIGIVGDKAEEASQHDPRMTLGELAHLLEYGGGNIPARPFINGVIHPQEALNAAKRVAEAILKKRSPEQAMNIEGEQLAERLRKHLMSGADVVHNAPETIRKKGYDRPLYETGQLEQALGHVLIHGHQASDADANIEEFSEV